MAPILLREVLEEIWATFILPLADKRRLCHAAVARAQGIVPPIAGCEGGNIAVDQVVWSLEDTIAAIGTHHSKHKSEFSITAAKASLRLLGHQGKQLASRLGKQQVPQCKVSP